MCSCTKCVFACVFACLLCAALAAGQSASLGLGRAASPEEVESWGTIVGPDGQGLPPGSATAAEGRSLYDRRCAVCHGPTGREGPDDRLAGGQGLLATDEARKTVGSYWPTATTLWDYVYRAMPFNQPGSLSTDEVYAAVAYVLYLNDIVGEQEPVDAASLLAIAMPNRDGFVSDPRPDIGSSAVAATTTAQVRVAGGAALGEVAAFTTPWGEPDLQGVWSYATITPLQRSTDLTDRSQLTEEEVAAYNQASAVRATSERRSDLSAERDLALAYNQVWWDRGQATDRTSLIIDPSNGRLPPLTPDARERQAANQAYRVDHAYDSWNDRPLQERCMTYQRVPPVPSGYSNTYQIFQSPGYVAILNEMIHDVRVVPVDGREPVHGRIQQWNGDSRGHWDGATLVVETRNYRDTTTWRGFSGSRHLRAVERFTRLDNDEIDYRYTIYDDTTYTRPFTVQLPLVSPPGYVVYEYACHEGNYAMTNVLSGARAQEKTATDEGSR